MAVINTIKLFCLSALRCIKGNSLKVPDPWACYGAPAGVSASTFKHTFPTAFRSKTLAFPKKLCAKTDVYEMNYS